jgi:beta-lactamase regulating signal transducer with metallopeptidase domain
MSALDTLLSTPLAYHLGWTLVHFLWQGALVGALYACLRFILRDSEPQSRYWLSLLMLVVLAALPVFTFIHLLGSPLSIPDIAGVAQSAHALRIAPETSLFATLREFLHPIVPWTVPAWCFGVALMALRSYTGWQKTRSLTRDGAHDAPIEWQDTLVDLAAQVGVRVQVRLMIAAKVAVPCVVGWMKPVILLPPAALTGLSPTQLEMVLAHELAHIRRHDYLVNLLQLLVETLLFYHPVVRWISQDARRERELCCDDSAVHACGDPLHYAHALTDLADIQAADMRLAIGLNGGDLTLRVERLIAPHHVSESAPRLPTLMLATAVFLSGLMMIASADHMPMPLNQMHGFSLYQPFLQHDTAYTRDADVRAVILPTRVRPEAWHRPGPETVETAQFVSGTLLAQLDDPIEAPAQMGVLAAALPVTSTPPAVEVHNVTIVSDSPISQSVGPGGVKKQATEPVRIISVNPQNEAPVSSAAHQYCTPITGSRVCGG